MMDIINHLALGFSVALTPENFMYCLIGAFVGTLVGVLPGVGRSPPSPSCCRSPSGSRRSPR